MGNKKVQDYLLAAGLTLGIAAGAVAGGKMLVDMDQLSTARTEKDKIRTAVITTETFRDMKSSAEEAVDLVYGLGLIDAKEHSKLEGKINTEDFAYNNRNKLVDPGTATSWENAVSDEYAEMGEMCTSAITAGGALAVAGFIAINMAYRKGKEAEASTIKKSAEVEEPVL